MIKLHQFPAAFGLPNASPFCMKVETYLRLADLEYEIANIMDPGKGPKGKAPFITDRDNIIPDSHFILKYLKKTYGDPLGDGTSEEENRTHHMLARMMEERLYFALVYIRWIQAENAPLVCDAFFSTMPSLIRKPFFKMIQKRVHKNLIAQGIARHTQAEIEDLAIEDLLVVSQILGTKAYFGGLKPREIDAVAWSFIANIIQPPTKSRSAKRLWS